MCNYNAICPLSNGRLYRYNYCCHRRQLVTPCAPRISTACECPSTETKTLHTTLSGSRDSPSTAKEVKLRTKNVNPTSNSTKKNSSKFKSIVEKMNNANSRQRLAPSKPVNRQSDTIKNATAKLCGKVNATNSNYSRLDQNSCSRKQTNNLSPTESNDVCALNDKEVQASCMALEENSLKQKILKNCLQKGKEQTEIVNVTRCHDREGIWFKCHVPLRINIPNKLVLQKPNNRNTRKQAAITNGERELEDYISNDTLRSIDGRYSPEQNSPQFGVSLNEFFASEDRIKANRNMGNKLKRGKSGKKINKRGKNAKENQNLLAESKLLNDLSVETLQSGMEDYYQKLSELKEQTLNIPPVSRRNLVNERCNNCKRNIVRNERSAVKPRINERHNVSENQKNHKTIVKAKNAETLQNNVNLGATENKLQNLPERIESVTSCNTPSVTSCCDKAITARRLSFQESDISENIKKFITDSNAQIKAEITRVREEFLKQLTKNNRSCKVKQQQKYDNVTQKPQPLSTQCSTIEPTTEQTLQSQATPLTQIQPKISTSTSYSSISVVDTELNNVYTEDKDSHIVVQTKPSKSSLKKSSNVSIKSSGTKIRLKRSSQSMIERDVVTPTMSKSSLSISQSNETKSETLKPSKIENRKKCSKKRETKKSTTSVESDNKSISDLPNDAKSKENLKSISKRKKSDRMDVSIDEEEPETSKSLVTLNESQEIDKSKPSIRNAATPPNSLLSTDNELPAKPLIKCRNESCKWRNPRNKFQNVSNTEPNNSASVTLNREVDTTLVEKRKKSKKHRNPAGEVEVCESQNYTRMEAAHLRTPVILVPYRMSCILDDGEIIGEKYINVAQPEPWYPLQQRSDTKSKGDKHNSKLKIHFKKKLRHLSSTTATTNTIATENSLAPVECKNSVETTTLLMPRHLTSDSNIQPTSYSNVKSFNDDSKHQLKKTVLYETTTVCNLHNLIEACSRPPANIMGIPRTTDTYLRTNNPHNPSRQTVSFMDVSCSNETHGTSTFAATDISGDHHDLSPDINKLRYSDISVATIKRLPIRHTVMMPSNAVQHIPVNFYQRTAQKYGFHPMDSFFRQNPMCTMKRHHPVVPRSIGGYNHYASYPYINENYSVPSNSLQVYSEPTLFQVPQHQFQHYIDHQCPSLPFGSAHHSIDNFQNYQNHFYYGPFNHQG